MRGRAPDYQVKGRWFNPTCRHFETFVHVTLPLSFGRNTKSRGSLLSGVYARGSKRSHISGKCVTCSRLRKKEKSLKAKLNNTLATTMWQHRVMSQPQEGEDNIVDFIYMVVVILASISILILKNICECIFILYFLVDRFNRITSRFL